MKSSNINWYETYKLWSMNSGDMEYLFKSTPFVSGKYMEDFEFTEKSCFELDGSIREKLKCSAKECNILILDTNTEEGIKAAILLNNEMRTAPILSYNFLFHPFGAVGNNKLVEDLYSASRIIKKIIPKTYAIILDSNRYRNDIDIENPMIFNNQYEVTEEELPDIDMLRLLNKRSVSFFYRAEIKEDVVCYLRYLKDSNFTVNIFDLEELKNEQ